MSLNWNLSRIENASEVCWITVDEGIPEQGIKPGESVMNPLTNVLIWATIGVGLGSITEANASEFYARLNLLEKLDGNFLIRATGEDGKRPEGIAARVQPEEVLAHIGLSCNVTDEPRSKWLKRIGNDLDRAADLYDRAAMKAAAAA